MAEDIAKNKVNIIDWPKNRWKLVVVFVLVVLIAAAMLIYSKNHNKEGTMAQASLDIELANEASLKGNKTQALEYARKALAIEPNNQTAIGFVATLTPSRTESQQLYGRLLDDYVKESGIKDPTPITYWSEANLAEKAGNISQAKKYYQEAITAAESSSNSYYQAVAQQAQAELKGLK